MDEPNNEHQTVHTNLEMKNNPIYTQLKEYYSKLPFDEQGINASTSNYVKEAQKLFSGKSFNECKQLILENFRSWVCAYAAWVIVDCILLIIL